MKIRFLLLAVVVPVCAQELPCECHFGLVARETLDLNGNNLYLDSFDSTDPSKSTAGLYDAAKKQANGNIALGVVLTNGLGVGAADIYGSVFTGPTGSVSGIGSLGPTFVAEARAISVAAAEVAGWIRRDCSVFMAGAALPENATVWPKPVGAIGSGDGIINKSVTLTSGDYKIGDVSLNSGQDGDTLTIAGSVRLYVTGSLDISGLGMVVINPAASLTVYVAGNVHIAGQAVINNAGRADRNVWLALDTSANWSVAGNGTFIGVIYAPNPTVNFRGGGASGDVSGAIMAKNIVLTGNTAFHYDEALHIPGQPWYRVCAAPEFEYEISGIEIAGTQALLRFPANAGKRFTLQYCDDLAAGPWSPVGSTNAGFTSVSCTNEILTASHSMAGVSSQRFYRLRVSPLP